MNKLITWLIGFTFLLTCFSCSSNNDKDLILRSASKESTKEVKLVDFFYSDFQSVKLPIFNTTPESISAGNSKTVVYLWNNFERYMSVYTLGNEEKSLINKVLVNIESSTMTLSKNDFENEYIDLLGAFDANQPMYFVLSEDKSFIAFLGRSKKDPTKYTEEIFFKPKFNDELMVATYRYKSQELLWIVNSML